MFHKAEVDVNQSKIKTASRRLFDVHFVTDSCHQKKTCANGKKKLKDSKTTRWRGGRRLARTKTRESFSWRKIGRREAVANAFIEIYYFFVVSVSLIHSEVFRSSNSQFKQSHFEALGTSPFIEFNLECSIIVSHRAFFEIVEVLHAFYEWTIKQSWAYIAQRFLITGGLLDWETLRNLCKRATGREQERLDRKMKTRSDNKLERSWMRRRRRRREWRRLWMKIKRRKGRSGRMGCW